MAISGDPQEIALQAVAPDGSLVDVSATPKGEEYVSSPRIEALLEAILLMLKKVYLQNADYLGVEVRDEDAASLPPSV